jgi:1-acyl-sn-glycerol-3-phosphate acyltransferase
MAYWALKALLSPVLRLLFRVRVEGLDNVAPCGPVILAGNHVSFCDSVFMPMVMRRRVTFVAKSEYFEDPKTAWIFRALGQIPMKREGGSASERALRAAREVLDDGGALGIYPEGTRSPDGRLHRGHTGVARLALGCHTPVVCAAVLGTAEVQPIGQVLPRLFLPVTIRFSKQLRFEHLASRRDDPRVLRQVTDEIMFELGRLSGQPYDPHYAVRHASLVGAEEARVESPDGHGRDQSGALAAAG